MPAPTRSARPTHVVLDCGVGLALVLVCIRALTIGWGVAFFDDVFSELPKVLAGATYDVLFAMLLTASFVALLALPCARRDGVHRALIATFHGLVVLTVLASLGNLPVVELLGKPLTYQWLYYSDFLRSADARAAMAASSSPRAVSVAASACLAAPLFGKLIGATFRRATRAWSSARATGTLLTVLGVYLWLGHWYLVTEKWPSARIQNPVVAFAASWMQSFAKPVLHLRATPYDGSDFGPGSDPLTAASGLRSASGPSALGTTHASALRNVILVVLESVGATDLDTFGGKHAVTPTLARLAPRSASFDRIYAHMPGTNPSLASLHGSVYPWISFKTVTAEHPDVKLESLPAQLAAHGRRTGYFSSASLDFQGAREFLAHRGYDLVQGPEDRRGARNALKSEWEYLHGTSDADTTDALIAWLAENRAEHAPSFALLWTLQAHYPYYVTGEVHDFKSGDASHDRYLSAVRESDAALGKLVDWLDTTGAAEATLLVVVADHGEAFGQHGSFGHGSALYEENLRVPLMLVNAELFHGERYDTLGGLVDVPPTILACLGVSAPSTWQGRSLFDADRHGRLYACAPWSDFLLGFREGNWKVILDTLSGEAQVYDLAADPDERTNLASQHAPFVEYAELRLASWLQHQETFYSNAFRHAAE